MIPKFVKTTEWMVPAYQPVRVRQHIWKGLATFRSGRQEFVFYYAPEIEGDGFHVERDIHKFMDAPGRFGLLLNWKNGRPCRPVVSVEWMHINDEP